MIQHQHDMQPMYIDPWLIRYMDDAEKKTFAIVLLLKARHRNSIIRDAKPAVIARKAGVSFYHEKPD